MIKQPYSTRVHRDVPLPALKGKTLAGSRWEPNAAENYIGAFDLAAMSEIGIWTRLLHSSGFASRVLIFVAEETPQLLKSLRTSFPPSRLQDVIIVDDSKGEWRDLVQPDRPERGFAMHVRGHEAEPLMVGVPTEEAWDLFQELANSHS